MSSADDFSDAQVSNFIHDFLDTFPKRALVELYAAQPAASLTLEELAERLQTDRFVLVRQCRELSEIGLLQYRYPDAHTRLWELAPTEWAHKMTRAVVAHWTQYPEKRYRIVRRGRSRQDKP